MDQQMIGLSLAFLWSLPSQYEHGYVCKRCISDQRLDDIKKIQTIVSSPCASSPSVDKMAIVLVWTTGHHRTSSRLIRPNWYFSIQELPDFTFNSLHQLTGHSELVLSYQLIYLKKAIGSFPELKLLSWKDAE